MYSYSLVLMVVPKGQRGAAVLGETKISQSYKDTNLHLFMN